MCLSTNNTNMCSIRAQDGAALQAVGDSSSASPGCVLGEFRSFPTWDGLVLASGYAKLRFISKQLLHILWDKQK